MTATELIMLLRHELSRPPAMAPEMIALLGKLLAEAEKNGTGAAAPAAPDEAEPTAAPAAGAADEQG